MVVGPLSELKIKAHKLFRDKFQHSRISRPKLIGPCFRSISMMEAIGLEAPFSDDEVKYAVWVCGSKWALKPDGFTFKFIKVTSGT